MKSSPIINYVILNSKKLLLFFAIYTIFFTNIAIANEDSSYNNSDQDFLGYDWQLNTIRKVIYKDYFKHERLRIDHKNLNDFSKKISSLQDQQNQHPAIKSNVIIDLNSEKYYNTSNNNYELLDSAAKIRFFSNLNLGNNFDINIQANLSPVRQNNQNQYPENLFFENEGLYLQELNLKYSQKNYAVIFGKTNLDFGTISMWNRGIWGSEISKQYFKLEKIAISSIFNYGDIKKTGIYNIGLSLFKNDQKYLDNSVFNKRVSNPSNKGYAGDDNFGKSWNLSLNILFDFDNKFNRPEKLAYHFAMINSSVNKEDSLITGKIKDEKGFVAAINYQKPISNNFDIDLLSEYVKMSNINGNIDISEKYFINNLIVSYNKNWQMVIANSNLKNKQSSGYNHNIAEFSFGYQFDKTKIFDKLLLQIGNKMGRYKNSDAINEYNSLALLLRYYKNF